MSGVVQYRPLVLIAELTHRCPLRCAYCSNPVELVGRRAELCTATWLSVMQQARALGVLQVHLTGGEPLLRDDVGEIARAATEHGLYTTLVTSGLSSRTSSDESRLSELAEAGVRAVQVSFQDTDDRAAAAVAGRHALALKLAFARRVRELGMSLTVNVVLHSENLARVEDFIRLGLDLGADRLELAHVQYQGWAGRNRDQLLPSGQLVTHADRVVAFAKLKHSAELDIVYVMPDHFSGRAKPCMGGWGQRALVVSPNGEVLPCHAAGSLPLEHARVPDQSLSEIWHDGAAFRAFRGEAWLEEPCKSCVERDQDYGGCRCQALALTGRVTAADPACRLSPEHGLITDLRRRTESSEPRAPYQLRRHAPERSSDIRGERHHVG